MQASCNFAERIKMKHQSSVRSCWVRLL